MSTAVTATKGPVPQLVLGRYRLGRRLGSGGFGSVYAGRDERLERDVAVKLLPRERIVGGRFEREARAAARLSHPAIVTLYEAAVDDEGAYLVSELVRGRTLDQLLAEGHLSDRDILGIAISVCDALMHAHEQGVIHRDVKPSNILIPARPISPGHVAKLTDFGVARIVGGDALSLTRTGDVLGTLAYMAPEQAEGRESGPGADLYSLAIVIYEALTGINPLRGLRAGPRSPRLGTYLPPLRRQRRDLPRTLGVAIDQAVRPRPSERGTVMDLRGAMTACLGQVGDVTGVVVPGWGGSDVAATQESDALPGPEWRDHGAGRGQEAEMRAGQARAAGPLAGGTETSAGQGPALVRGLGALCGALAAAWITGHLLGNAPLAGPLAGLIAAVALLVSPRWGWLATLVVLIGGVALKGQTGAALVLVLAAASPVILLIRRPSAWPLPAGAAALGLLGLSGAWPALVGRGRSGAWERAVLGGTGFLWIAAVAALSGRHLVGIHPPLPASSVWTPSPTVTLQDVLLPMLDSGVLAAAAIWAVAATLLPWLVAGRHPLVDLAAATVWSAVTVSAVQTVCPGDVQGLVLGAVLGAAIALIPAVPGLIGWIRGQASVVSRVP